MNSNEVLFPMYFTKWFLAFVAEVTEGEPFGGPDGLRIGDARLPIVSKADGDLGIVINSLPWYGSLGGINSETPIVASDRIELLQQVESKVFQESATFMALNVVPTEMPYIDSYRSILRPGIEVRRRTQVTELPNSLKGDAQTQLLNLLHPKTRNAIRKGLFQEFDIRVSYAEDLKVVNDLYLLHAENMAVMGSPPKPLSHFISLKQHAPEGALRIIAAYCEGEMIAALLTVTVGSTLEYLTPVIDQRFRSTQILSALIWFEMLDAIKRNVRWWNWGGTGWTQDSLYRFKSRFGGVPIEYLTLVNYSESGLKRLNQLGNFVPRSLEYFYVFPFENLQRSGC